MAFPFDMMVDGMLQPEMVPETVTMMKTAIEKGMNMSIIVNNRAGGNAPLIAQELVNQFLNDGIRYSQPILYSYTMVIVTAIRRREIHEMSEMWAH